MKSEGRVKMEEKGEEKGNGRLKGKGRIKVKGKLEYHLSNQNKVKEMVKEVFYAFQGIYTGTLEINIHVLSLKN